MLKKTKQCNWKTFKPLKQTNSNKKNGPNFHSRTLHKYYFPSWTSTLNVINNLKIHGLSPQAALHKLHFKATFKHHFIFHLHKMFVLLSTHKQWFTVTSLFLCRTKSETVQQPISAPDGSCSIGTSSLSSLYCGCSSRNKAI